MADSPGFAVQGCPQSATTGNSGVASTHALGPVLGASRSSSPPKQTTADAPDYPKGNHKLEFNFRLESGQAISDDQNFTMVHPDGTEEKCALSQGSLKRDGVPEGLYEINFKQIADCSWQYSTLSGEPSVGLRVTTVGFDDGTSVELSLYRRFQHTALGTMKATLAGNTATAKYRYKQELRQVAGGEFVFEARIGKKLAVSDILRIERLPSDSIGGIKQRLKELGYDPGPTNDLENEEMRNAVKAFQQDNSELTADGIAGPVTRRELEGC